MLQKEKDNMQNYTQGYNEIRMSLGSFGLPVGIGCDFDDDDDCGLDFDLSPGRNLDFEDDEEAVTDPLRERLFDLESDRTEIARACSTLDLDFPDLGLSELNNDLDLPELGMDFFALDLELGELSQELDWGDDPADEQTPATAESESPSPSSSAQNIRLRLSTHGGSASAPCPALRAVPVSNSSEAPIILAVSLRGLTLSGAISAVSAAIRKKRAELETPFSSSGNGKNYRWRYLGLRNNIISYRAELIPRKLAREQPAS